MENSEIILFDIPSRGRCSCWSPNTWKTRLVLNYKQLPYRTEWLEYPDIAPRLAELGIEPNPPGSWADYSCPAIRLPDGEHIMDSQKIVEKLEQLHPEPSLYLETKVQESVYGAVASMVNASISTIIPAAQRNILREPSASWHAADRERRFGKSLEQLEEDEGGEKAWEAVKPGLAALKAELSKHKRDDGPFVLGGTVSYGDFSIAGFFEWLKRADDILYERFIGYDASFKEHHEACQPWLAKKDD